MQSCPLPFRGLLHLLLRGFFLFLEIISSLVYPLIFEGQRKRNLPPLPEDEYEILTSPAIDLAAKIRNGSLKSRTVVQAFINRATAVHPYINAFVDTRFGDALKEADAVDDIIQRTPLNDRSQLFQSKPFLGVPFSTKDCMGVMGLRQTVGLVCRKNKVSSEDAPCVANLRKAGGIILGVTNVPELCMWMETYNNVYGRTNNPYHLGRTCGGSSGGEGAAIASASSPFGIGSDIGGSIRMPSFFCGLFGHKCSTGEPVSNAGQLPQPGAIRNGFLSTGPMTRFAKDLLPAFKALISNEEITETRLRLFEPVNVKELKVYTLGDLGGFPLMSNVDKELLRIQDELIHDLRHKAGLSVEKLGMEKDFYWSFSIWQEKMSSAKDEPPYALLLNDLEQPPIGAWMELLRWMAFKSSKFTLISIILALADKYNHFQSNPEFILLCDELRDKLNAQLGSNGVLLCPSHPVPAPYHGEPLLKPFNFAYTGIFNVLGVPVTQVPLGKLSERTHTPMGLQIVGGTNQDRLTIALAEEIERIHGGQTWINKF